MSQQTPPTPTASTAEQGNSTAAKAPTPCRMGCGFFGSEATGNCCSKCWMTSLKNQQQSQQSPCKEVDKEESPSRRPSCEAEEDLQEEEAAPVAAEEPYIASQQPPEQNDEKAEPPNTTNTQKKTKAKKKKFKNLLSEMMAPSSCGTDKDDRPWKQGLGGGTFTKVEKI